MGHRQWRGCGPRGEFEFNIPEGLFAMRGGRGWQGNWGPFHFDFGDGPGGWGAAAAAAAACSNPASFAWCCSSSSPTSRAMATT